MQLDLSSSSSELQPASQMGYGYMSRGKMEADGGGMMLNCVETLRQPEICPEDVLLSALGRRVQ